jgi:hypothetical protein
MYYESPMTFAAAPLQAKASSHPRPNQLDAEFPPHRLIGGDLL